MKNQFLVLVLSLIFLSSCAQVDTSGNQKVTATDTSKVIKTDEEWQQSLTPEQYYVTCEGGTEAAFTGQYWDFHGDGVYHCVRCGAPLFDSNTKFDSGSGWPSFTQPAQLAGVSEKQDLSHGMVRTEIVCSNCGAHLGHVFPDGPAPTGMRYCINSISLDFKER